MQANLCFLIEISMEIRMAKIRKAINEFFVTSAEFLFIIKHIFNGVILVCKLKTKYLPMQLQHEICRKCIRVGSCDSLQSKKLRHNSIFGDSSLSTLWPPLFPKYTCTNLRQLKKLSFAFLVFHLGFLQYRCIVSTHPRSLGFVLRLGLPMTKS